MQRIFGLSGFILLVGISIWFLHSDPPRDSATKQKRVPSFGVKPLPALPPPSMPLNQGVKPRKVAAMDLPRTTTPLEDIRARGVLGQDTKWLAKTLDKSDWTRDHTAEPWTYVNGNQVRMTFRTLASRVSGISVVFPPKALSADLTVVSEFLVGQHGGFPLHWEAFSRPETALKIGQFRHPDGRVIYYRGELRTTGDPPFGPKFVELSRRPFPDQPPNLEKHPDENTLPGLIKPSVK